MTGLDALLSARRERASHVQRLTVVCENYWPEFASTGQLIAELAEGLSATFEVEVPAFSLHLPGAQGARADVADDRA